MHLSLQILCPHQIQSYFNLSRMSTRFNHMINAFTSTRNWPGCLRFSTTIGHGFPSSPSSTAQLAPPPPPPKFVLGSLSLPSYDEDSLLMVQRQMSMISIPWEITNIICLLATWWFHSTSLLLSVRNWCIWLSSPAKHRCCTVFK